MNASVNFANLTFKGLKKKDILENTSYQHIVTVNAEFIVKAQRNERLRRIINENTSTFDGQVPYILAKLANKNLDFEKISGSDFIYDLCEFSKINNKKVFLLGGEKSANLESLRTLKRKYNIQLEGFSPPFKSYPFDYDHNLKIKNRIGEFKPDILLVGFGAEKQEYWLEDNKDFLKEIGVRKVIGCGGTFDFVSGRTSRAPKWIQNIGLEIVFRLIKEPKVFRFKRLLMSFQLFRYLN